MSSFEIAPRSDCRGPSESHSPSPPNWTEFYRPSSPAGSSNTMPPTRQTLLTSSTISAATGTTVGFLLDRLLGEPPNTLHPIVWLGRGLEKLEDRTYSDTKVAGLVHAGMALGAVALAGQLLDRALGRTTATAFSVAVACSGQMLGQSANHIGDQLVAGDLQEARRSLPTLVGRDPTDLTPQEISRAVVESVAENTVDAVTATLFFGTTWGPSGVLCHRVSNTLDAMVGHRTPQYEKFGWASARLDDALAAIPARLTVLALMIVRPRMAGSILRTIRRDAWRHPSPNGGLVEAGFACALDLRLGGENSYGGISEDRGTLGDGDEPQPVDIARAVRLSSQVSALFGFAPVAAIVGVHLYKGCILTHSHLRSGHA